MFLIRQAREVVPEPMLKLTRTAKNFSLVLAVAKKVSDIDNDNNDLVIVDTGR